MQLVCNSDITLHVFYTLVRLLQFNSLRTQHLHSVRRLPYDQSYCLNDNKPTATFFVTNLSALEKCESKFALKLFSIVASNMLWLDQYFQTSSAFGNIISFSKYDFCDISIEYIFKSPQQIQKYKKSVFGPDFLCFLVAFVCPGGPGTRF